jgi:hypothetical protein
MKNLALSFALIAITLWVGSLWAIGGIAAPILFSALPEIQLAGTLAVGIVCGIYLLIFRLASEGTRAFKQWFFWIVLVMLVLTLIGHFGVQPIIQHLKVQGGTAEVMQSVVASRFARWHGVASILYLIQSLLGLGLVLKNR